MRILLQSSRETRKRGIAECGMTLIELSVAMFVLTVGLMGIAALIVMAISSNGRNKRDSTGTMIAQMVIEQISALPASAAGLATGITDCTGAVLPVSTAGAAAPAGAGAQLYSSAANPPNLSSNIDFTQAVAAVPANYKMTYTTCGGGQRYVYDVRWNIITQPSSTTKLVTVAARQTTADGNARLFAFPVTLRAIVGN
jgi:Tfp pilus assembly protein PilV